MIPDRLYRVIGSTLLLVGAFVLGWVLRQTVVLGELSIASPAIVAGTIGGVVLVGVGWYFEQQFEPSEHVPDREGSEANGADEEPISPLADTGDSSMEEDG